MFESKTNSCSESYCMCVCQYNDGWLNYFITKEGTEFDSDLTYSLDLLYDYQLWMPLFKLMSWCRLLKIK